MFRLFAIISFLGIASATPVSNNGSLIISTNETGPFVKIHEAFYYIEAGLYKNWYDAYQTCNYLDSQLVAFETVEEFEAVVAYLVANKLDTLQYWTAGTDFAKWGTHVWFSNNQTIFADMYFEGEPNNARYVEHCDTVGFRNQNTPRYGLNDERCDYRFTYICETSKPNVNRITEYYVLTKV